MNERELYTPGILRATEDREQLIGKLAEYKSRIGHPDHNPQRLAYKIAIFEQLVSNGEVNIPQLESELRASQGANFNAEFFETARSVAEDYLKTGGKNLFGGTGLPERPIMDIEDGEIH